MKNHNEIVSPLNLAFSPYDERFLEKSWAWLNDPEIKALTLTPDFTREGQKCWFRSLPERSDYRIWGISCDGIPVGAIGLKHITANDAEYWGYIGERRLWGLGLGKRMVQFALEQAIGLCLKEVYLKVHSTNTRAVRLYTRAGFQADGEAEDLLVMRKHLARINP